MMDTEYLPSIEAAEYYKMKLCKFEKQEDCPQYHETQSRPGFVDLTCWYFREVYKDGWKCTAPWPLQGNYNESITLPGDDETD